MNAPLAQTQVSTNIHLRRQLGNYSRSKLKKYLIFATRSCTLEDLKKIYGLYKSIVSYFNKKKLAGQLTVTINFAFSFTEICWIHSFFAYVASEATFMPSFTGSPHQFSNEHLKMKWTVLEFCNFLYKKRKRFFLSSWEQHYDKFHIHIWCTDSNSKGQIISE